MTPDYPLPNYAARIWLSDGRIWLKFDRAKHPMSFPGTVAGLSSALRELSKGRSEATVARAVRQQGRKGAEV